MTPPILGGPGAAIWGKTILGKISATKVYKNKQSVLVNVSHVDFVWFTLIAQLTAPGSPRIGPSKNEGFITKNNN